MHRCILLLSQEKVERLSTAHPRLPAQTAARSEKQSLQSFSTIRCLVHVIWFEFNSPHTTFSSTHGPFAASIGTYPTDSSCLASQLLIQSLELLAIAKVGVKISITYTMHSSTTLQPLRSVSKSLGALPAAYAGAQVASRRYAGTIANFKIPTVNNEPNVSRSAFNSHCRFND